MFEIGEILKVKEEKKGRYTGTMVRQSYEILSIENTSVIFGHHKTTLIGLKEKDIKEIDLELIPIIFDLDLELTRKLKLKKVCSKMVTK